MEPTVEDVAGGRGPLRNESAQPGVVVGFAGARAVCHAIAVGARGVELGRADGSPLDDPSVSRQHARVTRLVDTWQVEDLGSRNGTFVDGRRVAGTSAVKGPRVLRLGSAVLLFCDDITPMRATPVKVYDGVVVGPKTSAVLGRVGNVAALGGNLHVTGETGVGKEIVARAFHSAGPHPAGPFIAVNCAAIPHGLAERLLFGARRGAFSGADSDAPGFIQAAHRGTLFLDELAELDSAVQAKLLRVVDAHEVTPLGAATPVAIDVRLCTASLRDLRTEVEAGRFREDLYFRLGRPSLNVPPLRERPCEVPALIAHALSKLPVAIALTGAFVEACLLRPWRGNVRELLHAVQEAASLAIAQAPPTLRPEHLTSEPARNGDDDAPEVGTDAHRAFVESAVLAEGGNISRAARAMGVHRTQLRRWLERYQLGASERSTDEGEEG